MRRLHRSEDSVMAGYLLGLLQADGIPCFIKNQALSGALGEVPFIECWPEIWIIDDNDYSRAQQIIDTVLKAPLQSRGWWRCGCGEKLEGQFGSCWQCGSDRPG